MSKNTVASWADIVEMFRQIPAKARANTNAKRAARLAEKESKLPPMTEQQRAVFALLEIRSFRLKGVEGATLVMGRLGRRVKVAPDGKIDGLTVEQWLLAFRL